MKRLNCYRPYKEYANKLQDWRQAARSRDWVGTRFKGLESPYGATFSELFRYVDTAQKHRELSRETREQLQQRIERVFLESIPQLPLTLGAAADVKVPSLFGILVRRVGDKVECVCVWPGDSGYQFQITSVHRLAIGFPGGRKVALDPFTIKEMGPRWAQRLAQGIPGSQATTGFTTCARFSRTSSTHGWNIHNNTSVRWQLLGSAQ